MNKQIKKEYSTEKYREIASEITDLMENYLSQVTHGRFARTIPFRNPEEMLAVWSTNIPDQGLGLDEGIRLLNKLLAETNKMHSPRNVGHQVSAPLPLASWAGHVGYLLNNSGAVYETSPAMTAIENQMIRWVAAVLGYDENSGGIFCNGGSLGNLTGILAARQAMMAGNVWHNGVNEADKPAAVLVSAQSHYSIKRAVQIAGLGGKAAIPVPYDANFRLDMDALHKVYQDTEASGRKVIAVAASACTTATGSFDPIDEIADFCQEHDLWLHVDGAHGAAMALSENQKHLVAGLHRADSVVWDLHKMMLMPSLLTAVIFKRKEDNYQAFAQEASYLFDSNEEEPWYDMAKRTVECTKAMNALNAFICLNVYGKNFFAEYLDYVNTLTRDYARLIENEPEMELATEPQCNIICYRCVPDGLNETETDQLNYRIRKALLEDGKFYVVQTQLNGKWYLRNTIINPLTTMAELKELLSDIQALAVQLRS